MAYADEMTTRQKSCLFRCCPHDLGVGRMTTAVSPVFCIGDYRWITVIPFKFARRTASVTS